MGDEATMPSGAGGLTENTITQGYMFNRFKNEHIQGILLIDNKTLCYYC